MIRKSAGKGLNDFLEDDISLKEMITHEEFKEKKAVPDNSDEEIAKVYETYCALVEKI